MSTSDKKVIKPSKKDIKQDIITKLEAALAHLKEVIGEKKFQAKIKKASKLFLHAAPKKPKVKKVKPAIKKETPAKKKVTPKVKKKVATKPKSAKKA